MWTIYSPHPDPLPGGEREFGAYFMCSTTVIRTIEFSSTPLSFREPLDGDDKGRERVEGGQYTPLTPEGRGGWCISYVLYNSCMNSRHRIYPPILQAAREMRQPQTPAEATLWRSLRGRNAQDIIKSLIKSGAQGKLALTRINEIPIPLPSLEEQAEIVRRVESLFAFADRLEARWRAGQELVEQLTPSLLAKAFRGELVEQDPEDESVAVLLERIKAERSVLKMLQNGIS